MRPAKRNPHIKSVNAEKNPYMRDDFWASGYFDFLWKNGISETYRERLNAIKAQALRSNGSIKHKSGLKYHSVLETAH